MKKAIFLFIIIVVPLCAENTGYLKFFTSNSWVIEIDGSVLHSDSVIALPEGRHHIKARPKISYNWPAVLVKDVVTIVKNDTLEYFLSAEKSTIKPIEYLLPPAKVTSYEKQRYTPAKLKYNNLKTGLILTSIAANWASFYFKRQADDYYKKYRSAGSRSDLNRYYDKTQQFDNISGIVLGLSVATLSAYIYLTITD